MVSNNGISEPSGCMSDISVQTVERNSSKQLSTTPDKSETELTAGVQKKKKKIKNTQEVTKTEFFIGQDKMREFSRKSSFFKATYNTTSFFQSYVQHKNK